MTQTIHSLMCAAWLLCAPCAFATGSMLCEGVPYSAEVQFQLSTGELTGLVVARMRGDEAASERFALSRRFADYKRRVMRIEATGLERPAHKAMLNISKARGTLTYGGAQYRLRCDWNSLG